MINDLQGAPEYVVVEPHTNACQKHRTQIVKAVMRNVSPSELSLYNAEPMDIWQCKKLNVHPTLQLVCANPSQHTVCLLFCCLNDSRENHIKVVSVALLLSSQNM